MKFPVRVIDDKGREYVESWEQPTVWDTHITTRWEFWCQCHRCKDHFTVYPWFNPTTGELVVNQSDCAIVSDKRGTRIIHRPHAINDIPACKGIATAINFNYRDVVEVRGKIKLLKQETEMLPYAEEIEAEVVDVTITPKGDVYVRGQRFSSIVQAVEIVEKLSLRYKLFRDLKARGLTSKQIAKRYDVTSGNVRQVLSRGKRTSVKARLVFYITEEQLEEDRRLLEYLNSLQNNKRSR